MGISGAEQEVVVAAHPDHAADFGSAGHSFRDWAGAVHLHFVLMSGDKATSASGREINLMGRHGGGAPLARTLKKSDDENSSAQSEVSH